MNKIEEHLGMIPPASIDSERFTLGAILLEKQGLLKVIDFLKAKHFYKEEHQYIYQIIIDLFTAGKEYDYHIVIMECNKLSNIKIEPKYIIELSSNIGSSQNILQHSQYIVENYMKREVILLSNELTKRSYENINIDEILDYAGTGLVNLDNIIENSETLDIETAISESLEYLQETKKEIKTGFFDLDTKLKIRNQNFIILAARPSQGKTALALNIAYNVSKVVPVGFFSLEMSFKEISYRLLTNVSGVPFDHFLNKLSETSLNKVGFAAEEIRNECKLFVNDTGGLSITKLRAKILELTLKHKVKFIIIDYLQLMDSKGENQNVRIGNISRNLKKMAKEFDIPILVLSQLSRDIEKRANKMPMLSDLRDSGSLEQDADTVLFLTNYHKSKIFENESGTVANGFCRIDCEKQRNGNVFYSEIMFKGMFQRFEDLNENFEDIEDIRPLNSKEDSKDEDGIPF